MLALQRFPHAQAKPAADKAGVVVVLRRAHARLAPLAERAGRGRARGHAPGHAPSGVRQPQQPDQGASLLAARRRGEAARDAAPGSRGRPTRELRAEQRAGASGARAVHTVRHPSRSIAMQPWPEAAPKRSGPWAALWPQRVAASSIGPASQAAAWAERPRRLVHRTAGDRTQAA